MKSLCFRGGKKKLQCSKVGSTSQTDHFSLRGKLILFVHPVLQNQPKINFRIIQLQNSPPPKKKKCLFSQKLLSSSSSTENPSKPIVSQSFRSSHIHSFDKEIPTFEFFGTSLNSQNSQPTCKQHSKPLLTFHSIAWLMTKSLLMLQKKMITLLTQNIQDEYTKMRVLETC